ELTPARRRGGARRPGERAPAFPGGPGPLPSVSRRAPETGALSFPTDERRAAFSRAELEGRMIAFTCPRCNQPLSVQDGLAGKPARCPQCGQVAAVPAAPPAPTRTSPGGNPLSAPQPTPAALKADVTPSAPSTVLPMAGAGSTLVTGGARPAAVPAGVS